MKELHLKPHLMMFNLLKMDVNPTLIMWVYSSPTHHPQQLRISDSVSVTMSLAALVKRAPPRDVYCPQHCSPFTLPVPGWGCPPYQFTQRHLHLGESAWWWWGILSAPWSSGLMKIFSSSTSAKQKIVNCRGGSATLCPPDDQKQASRGHHPVQIPGNCPEQQGGLEQE